MPTLWMYLDPGSGSMLLQLLLGGLASTGVVGRFLWRRVARRGRAEPSSSHEAR